MDIQSIIQTTHDTGRAKGFFEDKLAYTTGPVELDRMIKSGEVNVIDVREEEDYLKGHIPGAINLPKDQWDSFKGLDKEKTNVVYCYTITCHLAAMACLKFAEQGFPVMELDGGFEVWEENELEVEERRVEGRLAGV